MSKLAAIRQRLGAMIAGKPAARGQRMYHGAKQSRLTAGWGSSTTSADAEISSSLTSLRNRSRALMRDASYAKRARAIVVNNVVGSGIGLQAQVTTTRTTPAERINGGIEESWEQWCEAGRCHTGGTLHFSDLERLLLSQVFDAGEVLVRLHRRAFGDSAVPLALEVIESERLADEFTSPAAEAEGADVRMGVEVDKFHRPLAYWIRQGHPGDLRSRVGQGSERLERVPAADIIHLRIVDRWPQTRGVPWLHAAMRRLNDMDGYSEAEIVAARSAACVVGFIESPEAPLPEEGTEDTGPELAFEAGQISHLAPGEKFSGFNPSRPNPAMDPFMRLMLREVAAGCDVSYESVSRDYSQSNYSSSRLSLLDDRDTWRVLQAWFIRSLRAPLHRQWLQAAVLARAVPGVSVDEYALRPAKFEAVTWKPRGWTWVDPTREVNAYKEAIKAGMTTLTDVIAATGGGKDIEDVIRERRRELDMLEAAGIEVDTTVPEPVEPIEAADPAARPDAEDDTPSKPAAARVVHMTGRA